MLKMLICFEVSTKMIIFAVGGLQKDTAAYRNELIVNIL